MNWQCKTFSSLTTNELYDILSLRVEVFVVEQTCYYQDLDGRDKHPETLHLCCYQNNELVGYLRILAPNVSYEGYASLGRVVTSDKARGQGLGHQLVERALPLVKEYFAGFDCKISAQSHLTAYYEKHGFYTVGDEYLEDDIPHISMIYRF
jgi:ElaA protein